MSQYHQPLGCLLDELAALSDELVTASGDRTVDGAGGREHLAALLDGQACGEERAALARGLDNERAEREAADDAVAAREVLGERRAARREFRHQHAVLADARGERRVLGRIDAIKAGTEDRHREAACGERS